MSTVAILGTGKMGGAIAKELVAAGHQVFLWNRTAESATKLATEINSPLVTCSSKASEAVAAAEIVITMLVSGKITQQVLLDDGEVLNGATAGKIFIDMGTSGVETAKLLSDRLSARDLRFIDAPVSGSIATISAHQLLVMASGDEDAIAEVTPVLSVFSKKVANLGAAGNGQAMKLAVNLIVHTLDAAVSEGLAIAVNSGIPLSAAYDVLEESVVAAPFVKYKRAAFLDPEVPVAMRIDTVVKDLGLIDELGRTLGLSLATAPAVAQAFTNAVEAGLGERDMARLLELYLPKSH